MPPIARSCLFLAGLALGAHAAWAQPMDFATAQQQLRQRSDRLAASAQALQGAQLKREAAQGLGGPVISLGAMAYAYNASLDLNLDPINQSVGGAVAQLPPPLAGVLGRLPSLPPSYTLQRSDTNSTASVSGVWPIYTGGATEAARRLLGAQADEAQADATQTTEELQTLLVQRYFGAQLTERAAALREAALRNIEQHDSAAQKMLDAGVIARIERLQARAALEDARRQARKARDEAELAAAALGRTVKASARVRPTSPLFVLSEPVEPLPHFVDAALARHPGLAKINAKKGQAEQLHAAQEALRQPQVFAFGQRELKTGRSADWVAGVGVRWTLFDPLDRKTLAESSLRSIGQAQSLYEQARSDIELLVEKRWMALEQARQAFWSQQPALEVADEVLRLRQAGLREGTSTAQELIDAQLNQAKVQTERAQAAYEYIKALADLLEASGQGDEFERYMARANTKVE
jgi:outer membrane protein TolC